MRFKRKIKEEMRVLEIKRRKNIKKKEEGRKAGTKKGRDGRKERKGKRKEATGREEEKQNPESQNSHRIEALNDHTESSFKSVCYADPGHEEKNAPLHPCPGKLRVPFVTRD